MISWNIYILEIRCTDVSHMHSHIDTLYIREPRLRKCAHAQTSLTNVKYTHIEYIWENVMTHLFCHIQPSLSLKHTHAFTFVHHHITHTAACSEDMWQPCPDRNRQPHCNLCCFPQIQLPSLPHKPDQPAPNCFSHDGVQLQHDSEQKHKTFSDGDHWTVARADLMYLYWLHQPASVRFKMWMLSWYKESVQVNYVWWNVCIHIQLSTQDLSIIVFTRLTEIN